MPEIKKEANVDSVKMLGEYKATKLVELSENISRQNREQPCLWRLSRQNATNSLKSRASRKAKEEAKATEQVTIEKVESEAKKESEK